MVDPNNPYHTGTPDGWYPVGYDSASDAVLDYQHPFFDLTSLVPRNERATAFASGEYQVTDTMMVYGEALLNRRKTTINGYRQYWGYIYNSNFDFANFDVVDGAGNPLSAGWTGANWLSPTPITDHSGSVTEVDYHRFVVGLTGDITDTWYFDMSYQYSKSDGDYTTKIIYDDAISDQNFLAGSCEGTTTSVRGVDCIDIPWLSPATMRGELSPELRNFMFGTDTGNTVYKQKTFEAFAAGDLVDLPAGTVGAAVGIYYQKDEIVDTPGPATLASNVWGASTAGVTAGDDSTQAIFAELEVPVLSDLPMAESLDLTLSGRYTDVDSSGSDTTYKVGVNWTLGAGVRVRAGQSTSFRSPALFELYLNEQTASARQSLVDPCIRWGTELDAGNINQRTADNCAADGIAPDYAGGAISATTVTSGGLGVLEPETSTSNTFGVVYKPTFVEGLVMSVDYFDIEIEGEVTNLGGSSITFQCYNSENFATEPLCEQFDRDPMDQRITDIRGGYLNIASQTNRGYDVAISYNFETDYGTFDINAEGTRQLEASRQLFSTEEPEDRTGEFGRPNKVANFTLSWTSNEEWNVTWNARYVGSVSNHYRPFGAIDEYSDSATIRGQDVRLDFNDSGKVYHSLAVSKTLFDVSATLGVANLTDQEPPRVSDFGGVVSREGNSAFYSQYDWLGRRVFLNMSYDF
ncbi:MAG: TonB-dependent receptor [Pseudomonadota bacterium]|nr:TonB-dependent receptor [Pseudomonadota bacterium]